VNKKVTVPDGTATLRSLPRWPGHPLGIIWSSTATLIHQTMLY